MSVIASFCSVICNNSLYLFEKPEPSSIAAPPVMDREQQPKPTSVVGVTTPVVQKAEQKCCKQATTSINQEAAKGHLRLWMGWAGVQASSS